MPWSKVQNDIREPDPVHGQPLPAREIPYTEAIREALEQAMGIDPTVLVMGQGVDDPNGTFGVTRDLAVRFGPDRVFDTPLAENAMTGVAVGAAIAGMRPVHFHNRPDFLTLAMDQIVNHAAKWHFMFGGSVHVPMVVWACIGRGWGSAAQHSQALQGLFMHVPGLKLAMPSTAHDAKGIMLAAIADDNPVLLLEHRFNFRQRGLVPFEPYTVPLGKGVIRRIGRDVTILAISNMVAEAFAAADDLSLEGIEAEILDPRSLRPLDEGLILESLARTGRLVIADTGWRTGGVAAEIAAVAADKGFGLLKAPVLRVCAPDVPTPAGPTLEEEYYPGTRHIVTAAKKAVGR